LVAAATLRGSVQIFSLEKLKREDSYPEIPVEIINKLAFSHDGNTLAGVTDEGQIFIWHLNSGMS